MIVSIKYATIRFLSKIGTNGENLEIKWRNTKFHLHVYVYILLITLCINCTTMTFFYNNICGYWCSYQDLDWNLESNSLLAELIRS